MVTVGIPDVVARQEQEAEEIWQKAYGGQPPAAGAGEEPKPGEGDPAAPPIEPPAPPEPPAVPTPPAPSAPSTPPEPPAAGETVPRAEFDALKAEFERLQAAHDVLQGKTYAEVPRFAAENKALRDEIAALNVTIEDLRRGKGVQPAAAAATAVQSYRETAGYKNLVETYGEGYMKDMNEFIDSIIAPLRSVVAESREQQARSAGEQYHQALDTKVPGWDKIAVDPRFATMLREEEGNTGMPMYHFAKKWESEHRADKVIPYYEMFVKRHGQPAGTAPATATPKPGKDALVAPRATPGSAPAPTKTDVEWIPASELDKLAREEVQGVWRGREKELEALKAKHNLAIAENRVIAGR